MTDQTVLVTAGASGIGRAIAMRFHRAGAAVTVCDVDEEALDAIARAQSGIRTFAADVSRAEDVDALFQFMPSGDALDVLVNNAGIGGPRAPVDEVSIDEWRRTIDVNLTGAFLCLSQAARRMKARGAGAVINIVTASVRTGLPSRSAYIASKAGLLGLSHNAARELGPFGIRVNAVLPGHVDGPRGRGVLAQVAAAKGISVETATEAALRCVSMRTMVQPEEVADLVYWLASPKAKHVTGQAIGVDGNVEWEE